jgi:hypothetical protein
VAATRISQEAATSPKQGGRRTGRGRPPSLTLAAGSINTVSMASYFSSSSIAFPSTILTWPPQASPYW